jgi:GT2 family glycosyltransferase
MSERVTAIVLNWNGLEDTLACVRSLARLEDPRLDVIVVDNGSRLSPLRAIAEEFPPQCGVRVEVVENATNLGYAGGNNLGMRRALEHGADWVWVLNNDTVVATDDRTAVVGAKVLRSDAPDRLWVAWGRVTWRQSLIALDGEDALDDGRWDGERDVEWLPGCCLLFRAAALREVGLFDDEFFAYHEDVDWAARAHRAGWTCRYAGAARIYHHVHGSSGGVAHYGGFRKYLSARNTILYARKHAGALQWLRLLGAITLTFPLQLLRRSLRGEAAGVWIKQRGWRDGWRRRPIPLEELGLR